MGGPSSPRPSLGCLWPCACALSPRVSPASSSPPRRLTLCQTMEEGECFASAPDARYNVTECVGKVENENCSIACATGWTIDGALGLYTCGSESFTGELPTCTWCTGLTSDAKYNSADCVG